MRKKVLDLLPNADENIKQLQVTLSNTAIVELWTGCRR